MFGVSPQWILLLIFRFWPLQRVLQGLQGILLNRLTERSAVRPPHSPIHPDLQFSTRRGHRATREQEMAHKPRQRRTRPSADLIDRQLAGKPTGGANNRRRPQGTIGGTKSSCIKRVDDPQIATGQFPIDLAFVSTVNRIGDRGANASLADYSRARSRRLLAGSAIAFRCGTTSDPLSEALRTPPACVHDASRPPSSRSDRTVRPNHRVRG